MSFTNILFPVDVQGVEPCRRSLARVVDEVRARGARLCVVYVVPDFRTPLVAAYFPEGAEERLMAGAQEAMTRFVAENVPEDVDVAAVVRQGVPYEQVLAEARERGCDLIVVPHRDRSRMERWLLGSNTSKIVHHAECAVLVLREP